MILVHIGGVLNVVVVIGIVIGRGIVLILLPYAPVHAHGSGPGLLILSSAGFHSFQTYPIPDTEHPEGPYSINHETLTIYSVALIIKLPWSRERPKLYCCSLRVP